MRRRSNWAESRPYRQTRSFGFVDDVIDGLIRHMTIRANQMARSILGTLWSISLENSLK